MLVRLKESGSLLNSEEKHEGEIPSKLEKNCMLVYCGKFQSLDGEVEVDEAKLQKLMSNHNSIMSRMATGVGIKKYPPLQLDHSTSAKDTVGRFTGTLEMGEHTNEAGETVKALFGKTTILGKENVEKVLDGRWTNLSVGADFENGKLSELTITPFPAADDATLMSKKNKENTNSNLSKGEEDMPSIQEMRDQVAMYDKCKKHMTEALKMAGEEVEKKLGEMAPEEMKKMSADEDARMSKLAEAEEEEKKKLAEKEDEDKKKLAEEEDKKKTEMSRLSKDFRASEEKARLSLRKSNFSVRLSKLRAAGKITPAEIKTIKLDELAKASDENVDMFFKALDLNQPKVLAGLFGSAHSMDVSKLAKKMEMSRLEAESRKNMSMANKTTDSKLAEGEETTQIHIDTTPHVDMAADHAMIEKMMDEGKILEAKEMLKKLMESMKKSGAGADEVSGLGAEEEMKTLAEEVKKMQTGFTQITKLAGFVEA